MKLTGSTTDSKKPQPSLAAVAEREFKAGRKDPPRKPPRQSRERRDLKSKYAWKIEGVETITAIAYTKSEARAIFKRENVSIPLGAKIVRVREVPQLRKAVT